MQFRNMIVHVIPVLIIIAIFETLIIQIYLQASPCNSCNKFLYWAIAQAGGGLLLGYLSDIFCRRKFLIITQIFGVISIILLYYWGFETWILIFLGITFNPLTISRAALIDNFPKMSKVKIISLTFIAQFIPWCFYANFANSTTPVLFLILLAALLINLVISILFFEDLRDVKILQHDFMNRKIFYKNNRKKIFLTLSALLAAELVFFISDYSFKHAEFNNLLFSLLGIGCLFGVALAIFYRKTPHLSLLTISYGVGLIIATMPIFSLLILSFENINLSFQVALLASLGGLYLPFVYDVILSSTSIYYRGTACGTIELVIAISSVMGLTINQVFSPTGSAILYMGAGLFLIATLLQKRSETQVK